MRDRDLASLYGVPTKAFDQAVKRHADRFPGDFMFQLTMQEAREWWSHETPSRLRSQNVTLKRGQHKAGFEMEVVTCDLGEGALLHE